MPLAHTVALALRVQIHLLLVGGALVLGQIVPRLLGALHLLSQQRPERAGVGDLQLRGCMRVQERVSVS